jgi:hypothetical protein
MHEADFIEIVTPMLMKSTTLLSGRSGLTAGTTCGTQRLSVTHTIDTRKIITSHRKPSGGG